jgi:uncharacterized membrane protein YphA (DoxX/SURF4 family)
MIKSQGSTHQNSSAVDILLLVIRLWLGYNMIKSGNCVIDIIKSPAERHFFEKWFGDELHFPAPILMAILAKGTEFLGGIFVLGGILTRTSSIFIAFTMLVATLTANLGKNFTIDGGFTISYCLFALCLVIWGAGKYSFDHWLSTRGSH